MSGCKGRSAVACRPCHSQKLKCNGGTPCQRCARRSRECVYPARERLITVPENYVRQLERQANAARETSLSLSSPPGLCSVPAAAAASHPESGVAVQHEASLGSSSAEGFVQELKGLSSPPTAHDPDATTSPGSSSEREGCYTYSRLRFDFLRPEVSFRLPPKSYAFYLFEVFEEGFCDYHWYLRKEFRARLELTYLDPVSQSGDRNWLCKVSVVMALAETWIYGRSSPGEETPPCRLPGASLDPTSPPGSEFFDQGLLLLKTASEEVVLEHVEAYNLIVFYCYSLNRRKTAYSFASQSIALAKLLRLDRPRTCRGPGETDSDLRVQNEHRKRVWWTSYCLDRMVSTDLGLEPAPLAVPPLPSAEGLVGAEECAEFFDARLLAAQARLCEIKRCVVATTAAGGLRGAADDGERRRVLRPCLDMLRAWRESLGPEMMFEFTDGVPGGMMALPFARVLSSLYLRYHQCFILLLRPFYLQELAWVVQGRGPSVGSPSEPEAAAPRLSSINNEVAVSMKADCFHAARNNCKILLELCKYGKIAKFGYWESSHLFSSLAILSLAGITATNIPGGMGPGGDGDGDGDAGLYARARDLLEDMARAGNPASRDHEALLSDVESMVRKLSVEAAGSGDEVEGAVDSWVLSAGLTNLGYGAGMDDQVWGDVDWEDLLSTYAQGI